MAIRHSMISNLTIIMGTLIAYREYTELNNG